MKQIINDSKKEKYPLLIGVFFILLGIILNEYVLTALFSEDGLIEHHTKLSIWLFDGFCIGLGLLIIFTKSIFVFMEINELKSLLSRRKIFFDLIFTTLVGLLLIFQFSYLVSAISHNQDNQGVIVAIDPDAGSAISTSKRATWYSYAGGSSTVYGALYFRLAHTIHKFMPTFNNHITSEEQSEEKIHFALQLISLISMYGMSFLFGYVLTDKTKFRLLVTLLISTTFLNEYKWVEYILRTHSDLLFSFLASLFLFFLYKSKSEQKSHYLYFAAFIGGAALSSKFIFLFFLPSLIFLEIPPFSKKKFLKLFNLYLLIALSFFIIGFPEHFFIFPIVDTLMGSQRLSFAPTWGSFMNYWSLLVKQGWQPFLMLGISFFILGNRQPLNRDTVEKYLNLRIFAVAFFPFVFLLTRRILPFEGKTHYTLPFVAILLTAYAIWFSTLDMGWLSKIRNWFSRDIIKYTAAVVLLVSFEMFMGLVPRKVEKTLKSLRSCREETIDTYKVVNDFFKQGKFVFIDAYVPYNEQYSDLYYCSIKPTINVLTEYKPDIIALNKNYDSRWTVGERPSKLEISRADNWQQVRDFYIIFHKKSEVYDPLGQKWIKTYVNNCGVEIWEKQER